MFFDDHYEPATLDDHLNLMSFIEHMELEPDRKNICDVCGKKLHDDDLVLYPAGGKCTVACDACATGIAESIYAEWQAWAEENCEITVDKLPLFDKSFTYAPTREEYEWGDREAHTESAHWACCRHECTNYDELIRPLLRNDWKDELAYAAIRHRIGELLIERWPEITVDDDKDDHPVAQQ